MIQRPLFSIICLMLPLLLLITGCAHKPADDTEQQATSDGRYFSIRQFAADQFRNYRGTPFVIEKIISLNGTYDSVVINSYNAEWEPLLQTFLATDISADEYLDAYDAEVFDDGMGALVLYYTAKNDDLLTRTVQVRIDRVTHKILSVFIETGRKSFWNEEVQKLYYTPMKLIQIQEYSRPRLGRKKELHIIWRFII